MRSYLSGEDLVEKICWIQERPTTIHTEHQMANTWLWELWSHSFMLISSKVGGLISGIAIEASR